MKRRRLELPRRNWHYPLKVARLPIPPPLHSFFSCVSLLSRGNSTTSCRVESVRFLCPEQDSNLHVVKHSHLKRARLPFRHLGFGSDSTCPNVSGKRDSNSRPQPWQGCALPTELFPHFTTCCCLFQGLVVALSLKRSAKIGAFSETSKQISHFFLFLPGIWIHPFVNARRSLQNLWFWMWYRVEKLSEVMPFRFAFQFAQRLLPYLAYLIFPHRANEGQRKSMLWS